MATILFLDDQRLNRFENVRRRSGRPQPIEGSVYRDPHTNPLWGYPTVFQDEATGEWRMLYQGRICDGRIAAVLATSHDGLSWEPRDTTRDLDLPDRIVPHQILPLESFGELACCFVDAYAEPGERIKGLVTYPAADHIWRTRLWVSPDGLHWTLKEGVEWQESGPDPGVGVFWNDVRGSYVFTTRPDLADRRITVFETKDWQTFTEPALVLQADALDLPLTQPYGMPVVPYEGYYIGLLWLFHCSPEVKAHSPHKFYDGHVDCQLAYSLNGWHFQRGLRDTFIPNGAPGEPDCGCVYPSSVVAEQDGSLRIYASACTQEHGYRPPGSGSILAYRLRRDGFVYMESLAGPGFIGTRPLYWRGGQPSLNLQSPAGEARIQLTDEWGDVVQGYSFEDCEPFTGDDTQWQPAFKDGRTVTEQAGRILRIEVMLQNARLFAIRGDFVPLTAAHCWRFHQYGTVPELRKGY